MLLAAKQNNSNHAKNGEAGSVDKPAKHKTTDDNSSAAFQTTKLTLHVNCIRITDPHNALYLSVDP